MLREEGIIDAGDQESAPDAAAVDGTIAEIRSAVLGGNTYYYIRLIGSEVFFSISAAVSQEAVILSEGDQVTITYQLEPGSPAGAGDCALHGPCPAVRGKEYSGGGEALRRFPADRKRPRQSARPFGFGCLLAQVAAHQICSSSSRSTLRIRVRAWLWLVM